MIKDHRNSKSSKLFTYLRVWGRFLFSKNRFWSRALLCWLLSCLVITLDLFDSYDLRFRLRGEKNITPQIVVLEIDPSDLHPVNLNQYNNLSDNHFWSEKDWVMLLGRLLKLEPKAIGVTFSFESFLVNANFEKTQSDIFFNPKVVWASSTAYLEKSHSNQSASFGSIDLMQDGDGLVRRLKTLPFPYLSFAEKLIGEKIPLTDNPISVINFKANDKVTILDLKTLLRADFPKEFLKDKYIIIGTKSSVSHQIYTPMGLTYRSLVWANITDNLLTNSFIKKLNLLFYFLALFGMMVICVLIITNYPQTVSFFAFIWIATLWSAFSIWIFDSFAIWLPITGLIALLILIWISHIGYQAVIIERAHYQLQQEQRYLEELEQLKNNFVSLISHDLKTPIAKIQAVVDRVMMQNKIEPELKNDFENLKVYSEELNRYIQSILKLLRVESKEFKINKETADINTIIESVVENVRPLYVQKNIQVKLNLEPMFLIEFDVTLMTEVILNLVENAIKYSPNDGQIFVRTSESDSDVLIEITDTGEGISDEDQEHIWKKFTRGKNQDLKTKGSGLGLYLVKYFVELHQGKISFKSQLGKGTSFYIQLPIDPI